MKKKIEKIFVQERFSVEQLEQRLEMAKWSLFVKSSQNSKDGFSVSGGVRASF
ncbi:hypothetical protein [Bacteroides heparinolyticus]|uniref:hypothetical protein n=1 Tax=Prevotella heparinolytica TaxID=28113 RepID=UPI0014052FB4|nr:hypothetical protein [Bacteroides heparinolyticus]